MPSQPRFTLAIPTYNRATLLERAIGCALNQTYFNLEVLVMDNASTDATPEVVERFGEGVRYVRNERNLGATGNFLAAVREARGEFFAFLQDDDLLFPEFVSRAVDAMRTPGHDAYLCFCAMSYSTESVYQSQVVGPPFALNWAGATPRALDGFFVPLLSLFFNVAIPPTYAFRRENFLKGLPLIPVPELASLLGERSFLVAAVGDGKVVADPWVGGLHYKHADQLSNLFGAPQQFLSDWIDWVALLEPVWRSLPADWESRFADLLSEFPERYRQQWYETNRWWPAAQCAGVPGRVRELLRASLSTPESERRATLKDVLHNLTPPWIWGLGKRALSRG